MSNKIPNFRQWKNCSNLYDIEEEFEKSGEIIRETMKHHKPRFDDGSRNTKTKERK